MILLVLVITLSASRTSEANFFWPERIVANISTLGISANSYLKFAISNSIVANNGIGGDA